MFALHSSFKVPMSASFSPKVTRTMPTVRCTSSSEKLSNLKKSLCNLHKHRKTRFVSFLTASKAHIQNDIKEIDLIAKDLFDYNENDSSMNTSNEVNDEEIRSIIVDDDSFFE